MSDIFQEVDDALQQEKLEKIWKEYGSTIVTMIAVVILTVAGWSAYKSWNKAQNEKATSAIIAALETEDPQTALQKIVDKGGKGHQSVSIFALAAEHLNQGDKEGAQAVYQNAIDEKLLGGQFADIARIMLVRLKLEAAADDMEAAPLLEILQPVIKKSKSWSNVAKLEAALVQAHIGKDYAAANALLQEVTDDPNALPEINKRAQTMQHVYGILNNQQTPADENTQNSN